jgi:uncharacterized repeat protein (TIGR04076 family)
MSAPNESVKRFGDRIGYTASDMEQFGEDDPRIRHLKRIESAASQYSIVAEVVETKHCNSGYRVGDRFVLDAVGNFVSKLCPKKICLYAVSQLIVPVTLIKERIGEGLAPNAFHFMQRVRCLDVGVDCKGYGCIMMQVSAIPRDKG